MAHNQPSILNLYEATASEVETMLKNQQVTTLLLVAWYLEQIKKANPSLRAVIAAAPERELLERAAVLDEERAKGKCRSRLHGIPILIQDNVNTLGMGTTAGSFALVGATAHKNAEMVQRIIDSGLIIVGKTNLSELNGWKSSSLTPGWSAVGGLIQSAYLCNDLNQPAPDFVEYSNPGGSSSGSAVALSAGMAPLSIATDTLGSLTHSAGRAALFAIKPTNGITPQNGILTISPLCDSSGPMAKTPLDLANLLNLLVYPSTPSVPRGGYQTVLTSSWETLKVGFLDPAEWKALPELEPTRPVDVEQMRTATLTAYENIKQRAKSTREYVNLSNIEALKLDGQNALHTYYQAQFKQSFEIYTSSLTSSPVHKLQELIDFNQNRSENDTSIPGTKEHAQQDRLEAALNHDISNATMNAAFAHARKVAKTEGLDRIFKNCRVDVIIGPADSGMGMIAAASGHPIATLPLGYLLSNGQPFALAAIAPACKEATLFKVMSAWEAIMPPRRIPGQTRLNSQAQQALQTVLAFLEGSGT